MIEFFSALVYPMLHISLGLALLMSTLVIVMLGDVLFTDVYEEHRGYLRDNTSHFTSGNELTVNSPLDEKSRSWSYGKNLLTPINNEVTPFHQRFIYE